jgi:hypothetical protein
VAELRAVAAGLARVRGAPDAQAYALDTLSRQYVSDAETLDELLRYFSTTGSLKVQRAIAGILIRATIARSPRRSSSRRCASIA